MVGLKEEHLEDLTAQLHELRMKEAGYNDDSCCRFDEGEDSTWNNYISLQ